MFPKLILTVLSYMYRWTTVGGLCCFPFWFVVSKRQNIFTNSFMSLNDHFPRGHAENFIVLVAAQIKKENGCSLKWPTFGACT